MGMITITTAGSFGSKTKTFSALTNGHADAVAQAIECLAKEFLPDATSLDHKLHAEGAAPNGGWKRTP